ncbi:hypothetical protein C8R47DRAFT_1313789 [Mycena vitilis]|nr:hypothetical protein C8R47DRAFT_1313789 [Mycena vitilis]
MSFPPSVAHSLPAETLSDIFRLAVAPVAPEFWWQTPLAAAPLLKAELAHLANAPLLTMSRVCSRWHRIAMNTPTLWLKIEINGEALRGRTRSAVDKTLVLLNARLRRSLDAPLSISLKCDDEPLHSRIFGLLAQHSHRWETVHFGCSLKGIDTSVLRGRLPRLKNLSFLAAPEAIDFLDIVPCLKALDGIPPSVLHSESFGALFRRQSIRSLACQVDRRRDFHAAISLLPKLPVATDLYLRIKEGPGGHSPFHWSMPLQLPSVTAPISTLVCVALIPAHVTAALRQIFASLTLPYLRQAALACGFYPKVVFEWPHTEFLGLCERSDLGRCLQALQIAEVRITERELTQILAVLPALERLEIGDVPATAVKAGNDSAPILITDSFLRAMTHSQAPDDCLAPRLSYLVCVSRLGFTPSLLIAFVASRVARISEVGSSNIFHLCIHPLPESDAALNAVVRTKLREMAASHKRFVYQTGERYMSQFERHS